MINLRRYITPIIFVGVIVAKLIFYFTMDDQLLAYVEDNFTKECSVEKGCSKSFLYKINRLGVNEYDLIEGEDGKNDILWMCLFGENKCYMYQKNAFKDDDIQIAIKEQSLKIISDSFIEFKYVEEQVSEVEVTKK